MPITLTKDAYAFHELDDRAKENARSWWREGALDYEWFDAVYDDFDTIAQILGIEVDAKYFTGFWSQGDGASFTGSYRYAKGASANIRKYAPKDAELHRIADELQSAQKRVFYQAVASISQSGRYAHEMTMSVDVEPHDGREWSQDTYDDTQGAIEDLMRDLARWLYRQLEKECEYLLSDENADDMIQANEYLFDENGRFVL